MFDFVFLAPGQAKAKVHTRIIMSPEHAKRLLLVLQDNVSKYESRFDKIALPEMNQMSEPSKTMQ